MYTFGSNLTCEDEEETRPELMAMEVLLFNFTKKKKKNRNLKFGEKNCSYTKQQDEEESDVASVHATSAYTSAFLTPLQSI